MTKTDEEFMRFALVEAQKAYEANEVPIGAVLVFQNQIISSAYNQVESLKDATAHAEMLCLKKAAEKLGNWRLLDCTLYCTLEPCLMCAGAMILSRVKTLVWGAPDLRHGAGGSLMDVFAINHPIHQLEIRQGILKDESASLLKKFFQERRQERRNV
jgi:tRNA(adenine34) deaminase